MTTSDPTTRHAACPVCARQSWGPAIARVTELQRCRHCGFVERRHEPEGDWANLYDSDYYPSYFQRADQWRFEARRRLSWIRLHHQPHRALEIGSGGGYFVQTARRTGIEAQGVELSPVAARHARDVLGVPVSTGAFEATTFDSRFDLVAAFHVLEHVTDPRAFLTDAFALLAPGGVLALEVPNVESAGARAEGADWPHLLPAHHLSHFAPPTLLRLAAQAGFVPLTCDTVFEHHYRPPAQLARRAGVAQLLRTRRQTGGLRSSHHELGDHVRLLARRP
jgi:2-polyprenyl-3-methyl-5-hydroxy-6-metoxy-1,4-benzoquinol methylase